MAKVTSEIFSFPLFRVSRHACCSCYMRLLEKKKNVRRKKGNEKRNSARPIFATGNVKSFGTTRLFSSLVIDIASHRCIHQYAHPFTTFLRVTNVGYCSHIPWFISVGGDSTEIRRCMQCDYEMQRVLWQSRMLVRVSRAFVLCLHTRNSIRYIGNSA